MNKKNVLQLISSIGFFGAENVIIELAKSLYHSEYHPIIGVIKNNYNPHLEIVDVAKKHKLDTKIFTCNSPLSMKTIFDIRKFVEQREIKIIHPHGYKSNFYAILSTMFKDVCLICTCHPWLETNESYKAKLYAWLDKLLLKRFDRIVAVSDNVKDDIVEQGISEEAITLIYNGIDIARFSKSFKRKELCKKYNLNPNRVIIGTIGRLSKEKAQEVLIEAAKLVVEVIPESHYLIVGDGPLNETLRDKVTASNLQDYVVFIGVSDKIPEILSLIDVFVLPSLSEGLPMVLLEAMAARKPIIATNVGAIPKAITSDETGVLIEPQNEKQLAEAIIDLTTNKDKRAYIIKKAYKKVVTEFSSGTMSKEYMKIYEQILKPE